MPSVVAVLAGNSIVSLKEIKQVSVSSTCRECVLVSGLTEVRGGGVIVKVFLPLRACTLSIDISCTALHVHVCKLN